MTPTPYEKKRGMSDEMDLGETFKSLKLEKQEKRRNNLQHSLEVLLRARFIPVMLNPFHYRVRGFDFWPTTGKFKNLETKKTGRGVFNLIKELKK